jgi:hypothetical protein
MQMATPTTLPISTAQTTNQSPSFSDRVDKIYEQNHPGLASHAADTKAARLKNVQNYKLNPLSFKNPVDRGAAILDRAQGMLKNPKFKALPQARQDDVLGKYYDKVVAPGYAGNSFPAPDRKTWLANIRSTKDSAATYYQNSMEEGLSRTFASAVQESGKIFGGMMQAGTAISREQAHVLLGTADFFHTAVNNPHTAFFPQEYKQSDSLKKKLAASDRGFDAISKGESKMSNGIISSSSFWLQNHPTKSFSGRVDSFIGENLVQLPFYEAIGAARIGMMAKGTPGIKAAVEAAQGVKGLKPLANLTSMLGKSAAGKFVGRRLMDATDGLLGSGLQGDDKKTMLGSAMGFSMFGGAVESASGTASILSRGLRKAWLSKVASTGGKPLVDAALTHAEHDLSSLNEEGEGIVLGKDKSGHQISIHRPSKQAGYVKVGKEKMPYSTKAEQQQIIDRAIKHHAADDPVHHAVVTGAKAIIDSTAREVTGKPFIKMTTADLAKLHYHLSQLSKEAIQETAIHNPDISATLAKQELKTQTEKDPVFAKNVADFEKRFGTKVSDALVSSELEQVKEETGFKSSQVASAKAAKSTVLKGQALKEAKGNARSVQNAAPRTYASFKVSALSYFKNPAGKLADKPNFNFKDWLEDMDSEDFDSELKANIGDFPVIEGKKNRLLYAFQHMKDAPPAFGVRVQEELAQTVKGGIAKWKQLADRLEDHIERADETGHLFSDDPSGNTGRIFGSTKIENLTAPTQWQAQLMDEQEDLEMTRLQKALKQYPEVFEASKSILKGFQDQRKTAVSVRLRKVAKRKIENFIASKGGS